MDDAARPQSRSSTRIPGRRSRPVASHSVNQSEQAPPLALASTHSGLYFEKRGNRSETSCFSGAIKSNSLSPEIMQRALVVLVGHLELPSEPNARIGHVNDPLLWEWSLANTGQTTELRKQERPNKPRSRSPITPSAV